MEKSKEKTEEKDEKAKVLSARPNKESEFDKMLEKYFMLERMFGKKEDLKRKMRIDIFY